ncbi:RNA-directed DNA polymerase from mobile element jockey [Trichonephila clavipes]|nr:RNA-directed DNA polymerase from mobile element jockey [Trichonephila clavipes]
MKKEKRDVPLRTAYSQVGRCGMQPKAKHSLRAQAQLSETKTETVETFELVKVEPKLLREKKGERERVKANFDFSNKGFPEAGCPQGSCLSPHLYNIYTYDFPHHPSVSICLFADDAAVLAQGANLKYTQCALQRYLHTLESWLTDWRIAINVDKTQAIVFRKHGRSKIPKTLYLFDEDIAWVNVVRYLGLFLDSSLTYRQHTKYICDKFWTKIHLSISLIERRSPLSLRNKVLLYKQVLRPLLTYATPVWGAAAPTTIKKVQTMQNKILRIMTNAPWYIRNSVLHHDLKIDPIGDYITKRSRNVFRTIENHPNPHTNSSTNNFHYPQ